MRHSRLERLFLRYRERGDTAALTRLFDRVAPALLALASRLVREPDQAEDLVQATFTSAIEHAERFDPERPLYPWLVGILTREARLWNRRSGRAPEAGRLEASPSGDPVEEVGAQELDGVLRKALGRLPARDARVLHAYLIEGKKPREIASAEGLEPGTARVRIHRGLARLRRDLPPSFAYGSAAALATRGLDRVRAEILATARRVHPGAGAQVGRSLSPLLMPKAALIGAALTAGALLTTFVVLEDGPGDEEGSLAGPATAVVEEGAVNAAGSPAPGRARSTEPETRSPLSNAAVAEVEETVEVPPLAAQIVGRIGLPSRREELDTWIAFLPLDAQETPTQEGRVQSPRKGAGPFRLVVPTAGPGWAVVCAKGLRPMARRVELEPDATVDLGYLPLERDEVIEGVARYMGRPFSAGGSIHAQMPAEEGLDFLSVGTERLVFDGFGFELRDATASTDENGRFELGGLRPGPYDLILMLSSRDIGPISSIGEPGDFAEPVVAPATGLVLDSPYSVYHVEAHCAGRPLRRVAFWVRAADGGGSTVTTYDSPMPLVGCPGSRFELELVKPGYESVAWSFDAADFDESGTLRVEMTRVETLGDFALQLIGDGASESGPVRVILDVEGAPEGWRVYETVQLVSGRFVLDEVPLGSISLQLTPLVVPERAPRDQSWLVPLEDRFELAPEGAGSVQCPALRGGRIALRLRGLTDQEAWVSVQDASGRSRRPSAYLFAGSPGEPATRSSSLITSGATHVLDPALPAGTYQLSVGGLGRHLEPIPVEVRAGELSEVELDLDA